MTIPSHLISLVVQCTHCARVHAASGLLHIASTPRAEVYKGSMTTCAHAEVQSSV
ncbi:hypothetical protein FIBSPDRAFT_97544 [Athelia psychrophila]|uniref:Uncharacterized protein n=1 Tax=Athelia psychrophila TaxID=1759441 RepID=A0A166DPH8_9AGAM|nr:hypothetical protein FIBSPDRAFT_97544 [Fibularhizoctonia sp. CBS 109695]